MLLLLLLIMLPELIGSTAFSEASFYANKLE